ncbi:MAG: helix-turn-helix domain-containing protein [Bacteroidota bacterium]
MGRPTKQNNQTEIGYIKELLSRIEKKVDSIHIRVNVSKDFLATREACNYLGVCRSRLWKLVQEGKITPSEEENGRKRYATAELKKYLAGEVKEDTITA